MATPTIEMPLLSPLRMSTSLTLTSGVPPIAWRTIPSPLKPSNGEPDGQGETIGMTEARAKPMFPASSYAYTVAVPPEGVPVDSTTFPEASV
jgi:hypothetical protein